MKELNLYRILYEFLGGEISFTEIKSFIHFLKGCGAYEEFIKEIDTEQLRQVKLYYAEKYHLLYYNIINASLQWRTTTSGFEYWKLINNLHQSILIIKCKNKLLDKNNKLYNDLSKRYISFSDIRYMIDVCVSLNQENTKLEFFIKRLNFYVKDNNLIK